MDEAAFDEPHDAVMELVLSSDDEYADADPAEIEAHREERAVRLRELATRFLPGVDAGALIALAAAMVSLTSAAAVEIAAQNRSISYQRVEIGPGGDPLAIYRSMEHFRFLGQSAFAAAAVVVSFVVLSRWRPDRHARWSRPAGQAALLLGVVGVVIGLLGYFDVIGALPAPSDIPRSNDLQG